MAFEPRYHEILLRLADEEVEVIVVGMTAAVLQDEDLLGQSVLVDFEGRPLRLLALRDHQDPRWTAQRPCGDSLYPIDLDEIERQSG